MFFIVEDNADRGGPGGDDITPLLRGQKPCQDEDRPHSEDLWDRLTFLLAQSPNSSPNSFVRRLLTSPPTTIQVEGILILFATI